MTIRDETSKRTKIVTGRRERESRETSIVEQKPKKENIAHQQGNRPEELSTSQVYRSDLMARLEGVRPATPEEIEAEEGLMGEITGLIVEQTMTKIGYDFYEYFFLLWEAPQTTGIQDYNIYINERSSPMWGIWIWIDVNEAKVWSKILRPRSAEIEEAAMEAVEVTREYLINYEQYQFETEDMVGTGI